MLGGLSSWKQSQHLKIQCRDFPKVQWLRLLLLQGAHRWVPSLVGELRSHLLLGQISVCVYIYIYGGSDGKQSACNGGDLGSVTRSERSPGEGNGNPLQYSCLDNSTDRGACQATVHGITKSQTRLSD